MNPTTQQQMTTERSAPGLSLLASRLLASLKGRVRAARACRVHQHQQPMLAGFCGYRWEHAQHIRGGNP